MAGSRKLPADGPKKVTKAARRRQILDAAAVVVRKKGYAAADYDQIAAAARVTPANVAKHFPSKADILAGLYADFHAAAVGGPAADPPDPGGELADLPDRFRKAAKSYAGVVAAVLQTLAVRAADADFAAVTAGVRATEAAIADRIRAGQAAGVVRRPMDPATAARDWVRYLFGVELLRTTDAPAGPDAEPPPVADVLIHGLMKTDV